jgi:branched-chain amino acid transport system permease protein
MMAVRDHALAAEAMGVPIAMLKTRTFAISAMYTGIAGAIGAIAVAFVAPDSFNVFLSIYLFVGLVVGGVGSLLGPVFGALFVQFIPNLAQSVSKSAPGAVYGVILIAFLYFMPGGVAGALHRGVATWTKRRAASLPAEETCGALAADAAVPTPSEGGKAHVG